MATKETKFCDVYDTRTDVKTYRFTLCEVSCDGRDEAADVEIQREVVDFSPRALKRFRAFAKRGVTPPGAPDAP